MVAKIAGNFSQRSRGAYLFTEFLEQGGRGRGFSRGVVEQAGDHGENGGVVAQREPAFLRNAGEQGVEFVEGRGGERAVGGVDAADPGEFIVEHQTKGAAAADDGKTVRRLGGTEGKSHAVQSFFWRTDPDSSTAL